MGRREKLQKVDDGACSNRVLSLSVPTPIGRIHLAAADRGLVRVELPGANSELRLNVWVALHLPHASNRRGVSPILKKAATELESYFTGGLTAFTVSRHYLGTPFQAEVWKAVAEIPFAETRSYRDVAARIGRPNAVRAVGAAQAANPLPIVVPCHRVIASDGSLHGYAGGLELKEWLLEHEAARSGRTPGQHVRSLPERTGAQPRRRPRPLGERSKTHRPPSSGL
jgi:methylated-DNA-[protein]-cysteine S-methyltransferase